MFPKRHKSCIWFYYSANGGKSYLYLTVFEEKEKLPEWELIEDFRIILSNSTEPFELHVIRVRSSSEVDEIAKLLRKRAAMITYHNKTEESFLVYEPTVFVRGKYVVLAVTHDNNAVKLMLKNLI